MILRRLANCQGRHCSLGTFPRNRWELFVYCHRKSITLLQDVKCKNVYVEGKESYEVFVFFDLEKWRGVTIVYNKKLYLE